MPGRTLTGIEVEGVLLRAESRGSDLFDWDDVSGFGEAENFGMSFVGCGPAKTDVWRGRRGQTLIVRFKLPADGSPVKASYSEQ